MAEWSSTQLTTGQGRRALSKLCTGAGGQRARREAATVNTAGAGESVRSYVRRSVGDRGAALDLGLISFVALYFEMIAIRWLASDVRVFAYLKNLPLLAAFLGLGLGCALAT